MHKNLGKLCYYLFDGGINTKLVIVKIEKPKNRLITQMIYHCRSIENLEVYIFWDDEIEILI